MPSGGARPGSGRPKGSRNKLTLAKQVVAEVLDVSSERDIAKSIHSRGHQLLAELETLALDRSQPAAVRIVAAKSALPFLLPKCVEDKNSDADAFAASLIEQLHEGRARIAAMKDMSDAE